MTLFEKIQYLVEKTDLIVIHNYSEISEVDPSTQELLFLEGDIELCSSFDEEDFEIYEVSDYEKPVDVLSFVKLLDKVKKTAETTKSKIFIEVSSQPIYLASGIEEILDDIDYFLEIAHLIEFRYIDKKRTIEQAMKFLKK